MTRRRDKRILPLCLGIFVAVVSFAFLINRSNRDVEAADLSKFRPGNIISDYVMSNYRSMTKDEIQAFLTKKNPCDNRNRAYYDELVRLNPGVRWHWKDDHFVCISEELFGDGETIGEGKTAAEIIYETANEYKINPQVLIVLIQKESGLITDPIPNNYDYRTMTGFGCPDTAPCSSQYFGFKNQLRKAAWLFREVLDGGWTNYPLGENYVQYSPNAACGGSIVNIENLATSSLYRYTPYQPNAAAIAAGTGTAPCGAYGNRNFYAYFSNWFGDPTYDGFKDLMTPRYMVAKKDIKRINPYTGDEAKESMIKKGQTIFYTTKTIYNDSPCLRTKENTLREVNACVPMSDLAEISLVYEDVPEEEQLKFVKADAKKMNVREDKIALEIDSIIMRKFPKKFNFLGKKYFVTEFDSKEESPVVGFDAEGIIGAGEEYLDAREIVVAEKTEKTELSTNTDTVELREGQLIQVKAKIIVDDSQYYVTRYDYNGGDFVGVLVDKTATYEKMEEDAYLELLEDSERTVPVTGEYYDSLEKGRKLYYSSKININDKWYYRTKHNTENGINAVIDGDNLKKVD